MRCLAVLLGAVALAGCSATQTSPTIIGEAPQYCYTSQTIVTENGNEVQSRTRVDCTDDPVQKVVEKRLGMAPNCGHYTYWMNIGGNNVQRKGISCQRPDGSWEILNPNPIQY